MQGTPPDAGAAVGEKNLLIATEENGCVSLQRVSMAGEMLEALTIYPEEVLALDALMNAGRRLASARFGRCNSHGPVRRASAVCLNVGNS